MLASSDRYTQQAFRLGRSYGFQFHPELSADHLGRHYQADREALTALGLDVPALLSELPKLKGAESELTALLERLVHHFKRAVSG